MWGFTAVASHRAFSAGALLVFGGGLALYQMTSLVLGPAGSRELHFSLTIPAVDPYDVSEPRTSSINLALGTLAGPAPAASVFVPTARHRASDTPAGRRAATPAAPLPTPVAATPSTAPLPPIVSEPPTTHPSGHRVPPIVVLPGPPAGAQPGDGGD